MKQWLYLSWMSAVRELLTPARDRTVAVTRRGASRLIRTKAGRVATANLKRLADRLHPTDSPVRQHPSPTEIGPVADGSLTVKEASSWGNG